MIKNIIEYYINRKEQPNRCRICGKLIHTKQELVYLNRTCLKCERRLRYRVDKGI